MKIRLALLLPHLLGVCHAANPDFINDDQLTKNFESRLSKIAKKHTTLTMREADEATDSPTTCKVSLLPPKTNLPPSSVGDLYCQCSNAVVAIGSAFKCGKCHDWHQDGFSSGWIASPDGLVVTSAHLFSDGKEDPIGVMTFDGEVYPVKEIVAADKTKDIAILRIDTDGKKLPSLQLADHSEPGEEVHVISHPQGRLYCLTSGRISRFHRQKYEEDDKASDWMSITADFAGGSSGGPVLNERGEVVGMVASTLTAYSENTGCKKLPDPEVQMIFKDCVPLTSLRAMFQPKD